MAIIGLFSLLRKLHTLIGHRGEISNALFNYDATIIATASMDKTCKLWDSRSGTMIETLRCVCVCVCVLYVVI